jgi:hypothetical protein
MSRAAIDNQESHGSEVMQTTDGHHFRLRGKNLRTDSDPLGHWTGSTTHPGHSSLIPHHTHTHTYAEENTKKKKGSKGREKHKKKNTYVFVMQSVTELAPNVIIKNKKWEVSRGDMYKERKGNQNQVLFFFFESINGVTRSDEDTWKELIHHVFFLRIGCKISVDPQHRPKK